MFRLFTACKFRAPLAMSESFLPARVPLTIAKRRRYRRGLSLIEASMVLALSAVVVAGVMFYYQSASENQKLDALQSEFMATVGAIRGLYAGRSNYGGLENSQVISAGHLPPSLIDKSTNTIKNPFGGTVTVAPEFSNTQYSVEFTDIPQGPCIKLVLTPFGSGVAAIFVNGKQISVDPASATTWCSAGLNRMKWDLQR